MSDVLATDICIIGAGPVGIFAAFEAGMHGMKSVVVDSLEFAGGQCSALYPQKPIYDIPAHPSILAQKLIDNLMEQASRFSPTFLFKNKVINITKTSDGSVIVETDIGNKIIAKAVIIAAGCGFFGPNKPPLAGIEKYEEKSVFYLIKDKNFFANKKIVIAGGGDSAVDWAVELAPIASKIYMVHRRDKFRAMNESVEKMQKLASQGLIEMVIPFALNAIRGNEPSANIEGIEVKAMDGSTKMLDANYLLAFFGLTTDFGPLKNCGLHFDGLQIAVNPSTMASNLENVFAIGDACTYHNKLKLILTGFAEAATAIHKIKEIVFPGKVFNFEYSTTTFSS